MVDRPEAKTRYGYINRFSVHTIKFPKTGRNIPSQVESKRLKSILYRLDHLSPSGARFKVE